MLKKMLATLAAAAAVTLAVPAGQALAGPESFYGDICTRTAITSRPGAGTVRHTLNVGTNVYVQDFRAPGFAYVTYPSRGYVPTEDICPR